MTYYESYSKCKTMNELFAQVQKDVYIAIFINTDRLRYIQEAASKVVNEHLSKNEPDWCEIEIELNNYDKPKVTPIRH